MYLDVVGQPMIVLGSHEAAIDLLEKRSANYSDRTPSPMIEMYARNLRSTHLSLMRSRAGFSWALTLQRYGTKWRRHRRAMHQFLNANAVLEYAPSQRLEAHRLARRLLEHPSDFLHHIRQCVFTMPPKSVILTFM